MGSHSHQCTRTARQGSQWSAPFLRKRPREHARRRGVRDIFPRPRLHDRPNGREGTTDRVPSETWRPSLPSPPLPPSPHVSDCNETIDSESTNGESVTLQEVRCCVSFSKVRCVLASTSDAVASCDLEGAPDTLHARAAFVRLLRGPGFDLENATVCLASHRSDLVGLLETLHDCPVINAIIDTDRTGRVRAQHYATTRRSTEVWCENCWRAVCGISPCIQRKRSVCW